MAITLENNTKPSFFTDVVVDGESVEEFAVPDGTLPFANLVVWKKPYPISRIERVPGTTIIDFQKIWNNLYCYDGNQDGISELSYSKAYVVNSTEKENRGSCNAPEMCNTPTASYRWNVNDSYHIPYTNQPIRFMPGNSYLCVNDTVLFKQSDVIKAETPAKHVLNNDYKVSTYDGNKFYWTKYTVKHDEVLGTVDATDGIIIYWPSIDIKIKLKYSTSSALIKYYDVFAENNTAYKVNISLVYYVNAVSVIRPSTFTADIAPHTMTPTKIGQIAVSGIAIASKVQFEKIVVKNSNKTMIGGGFTCTYFGKPFETKRVDQVSPESGNIGNTPMATAEVDAVMPNYILNYRGHNSEPGEIAISLPTDGSYSDALYLLNDGPQSPS